MQINRLFKIIYLLQDKKRLTTKELAEHFEVSRRTILRDIDVLSAAGIPIYAIQGRGGGISLLDNFILNKMTISKEEQDRILFALQSLALTEQLEEKELLAKLQAFFQNTKNSWIEVDFSRWGADKAEKERFSLMKDAILQHKALSFDYSSNKGERLRRIVNPLRMVFKNNAWYLQGYCRWKEDYRTFKIFRMDHVEIMDEDRFDPDDYEAPQLGKAFCYPGRSIRLVLEYAKEAAYRAYDDFPLDQITREEDGNILVETEIVDNPDIYNYFLSLGKGVKIVEPAHVRERLLQVLEEIRQLYE